MHYGKIFLADIANGPGCRTSLFVSGCRRHCFGCFNSETWAFDFGQEYTSDTEAQIIRSLDGPEIDGLSVLGGEPMELENQAALAPLLEKTRALGKTIWVYSGYTFEELTNPGNEKCHGPYTALILSLIDVLVDGPFVLSEKDISLAFRGSRNQRILDMRKSLQKMRPVLWEPETEKPPAPVKGKESGRWVAREVEIWKRLGKV